eukprot:3402498-Pyramimonas_sp.AAC.1
MAEAARQVRDELQRLPISSKDVRSKGGRLIAQRAISRCIWRNDIHAAQKLKATAPDGTRFIDTVNGVV